MFMNQNSNIEPTYCGCYLFAYCLEFFVCKSSSLTMLLDAMPTHLNRASLPIRPRTTLLDDLVT